MDDFFEINVFAIKSKCFSLYVVRLSAEYAEIKCKPWVNASNAMRRQDES